LTEDTFGEARTVGVMVGSDVRERSGWANRSAGPMLDLVASKLRCPRVRPGTVRRSSLIERLAHDRRPIVSVVAPAGYGKTTLLAQWAETDGQAVAWVSVDDADNDPKVLLSYVAGALDAIEPVGERVFDALASPASAVPGSVVPRLCSAFSAMISPVVLVLDDVHVLHDRECRAALSVLADHVPDGSRLVLVGRSDPPVRVARLRAEGKVLEIGPSDLLLTVGEAASLLREAGVVLGEREVAELHRRTEGWPAGLYLAALCLREGGLLPSAVVSFGGDDRFVSEYMESEFLLRISARQRVFLTRTAVLERMCGPLCEAVLEVPGSAATLADLARSNMLLVPLDLRGQWYRYHHLFRDMLLAELQRHEPGLIPVLRRRAATWCVQNDLPEEALEYSIAAGDVDLAVRLVEKLGIQTYQQGRGATLQRWLGWLDERGGSAERPMVPVMAALVCALTARPVEAERWADAVDHWQYGDADRPDDPVAEAWAAVMRALLCRNGVEQMRADADEAVRRSAAVGSAAPAAALFQGLARVLSGDLEGGDASFQDAVRAGEQVGTPESVAEALTERSLIAMARNQWRRADSLAQQASAVPGRSGIDDALLCTVLARSALHQGDLPAVQRELVTAQRLRPLLTYAVPHSAVQFRIELTRVHLALGDIAGARILVREIDELLRRRPGLGTLVGEAEALRVQLAKERSSSVPGASALTAAELRLMPLLATHLSFPEIAADVFLSPNTVKSQAFSMYRKLGVTSRSQAVARARDLGLLEG
jgi:LuxR family transcriptional regulator, maltose regulon positive regulatory protein